MSLCVYFFILVATNRSIPVVVLALLCLLLIGILPASFLYLIFRPDTTQWDEEQTKLEDSIQQVLSDTAKDSLQEQGILNLMLSNTRELRHFYLISRKQARGSFALAIVMCIIGALILLLSIAALLFLENYRETLTIGAIGGVLTEFVAATALFIYRKTLDQFNHYYRSLHENERFLSILNLTARLCPSKQDEVYIRIIDSQLSYINQENWMNMDRSGPAPSKK